MINKHILGHFGIITSAIFISTLAYAGAPSAPGFEDDASNNFDVRSETLYGTAPTSSSKIDHDKEYRACIRVATTKPETALKAAQYWHSQGGGTGAKHCQALAMLQLKQYDQAAAILEDIGTSTRATISPNQRAGLLIEAAAAYKMAGEPLKGLELLDEAVDLSPNTPEGYTQRGVLLVVNRDYERALRDFDRTIIINPKSVDAYVYRANTLRYLNRLDEAMEAIQQAITISPNDTDALLERGVLHAMKGNKTAAAKDWNTILNIASSNDPAADAARINLQKLNRV